MDYTRCKMNEVFRGKEGWKFLPIANNLSLVRLHSLTGALLAGSKKNIINDSQDHFPNQLRLRKLKGVYVGMMLMQINVQLKSLS